MQSFILSAVLADRQLVHFPQAALMCCTRRVGLILRSRPIATIPELMYRGAVTDNTLLPKWAGRALLAYWLLPSAGHVLPPVMGNRLIGSWRANIMIVSSLAHHDSTPFLPGTHTIRVYPRHWVILYVPTPKQVKQSLPARMRRHCDQKAI